MLKLVTARLILYAGEPAWVERTLTHSLKDGMFQPSSKGQLGIIELPVEGLEPVLTQMGILPFVDTYIVHEGEDKALYLRGKPFAPSRWMEDI